MKFVVFSKTKIYFLLSVIIVSGCAVQLAPRYDAALYDGIIQANVKIMELFSLVSTGTDQTTYSQRQSAYNAVIGKIDALALQSKARPLPESPVSDKVNKYLEKRGVSPIASDVAPSATALEEVSKNLVKMKETDMNSGLKVLAVAAFKNAVIISMDQAITYESFLDR